MANNYTASHFNNNLYMEYKNSLVSTKTMQRKIFFQLENRLKESTIKKGRFISAPNQKIKFNTVYSLDLTR